LNVVDEHESKDILNKQKHESDDGKIPKKSRLSTLRQGRSRSVIRHCKRQRKGGKGRSKSFRGVSRSRLRKKKEQSKEWRKDSGGGETAILISDQKNNFGECDPVK